MARLRVWLRCVGQAVKANGLRALAGLVPFGESAYDIAADAWKRIREQYQSEQEQQAALQEVAQAPLHDVKFEAAAVAREVAADQPPELRQALQLYLVQVPAAVR